MTILLYVLKLHFLWIKERSRGKEGREGGKKKEKEAGEEKDLEIWLSPGQSCFSPSPQHHTGGAQERKAAPVSGEQRRQQGDPAGGVVHGLRTDW